MRNDHESLERIDALVKVDIFAGVSLKVVSSISSILSWKSYKKHERVLDHHNSDRNFFILLEGKLRIYNVSSLGKTISFDDLSSGSCFGELDALDGFGRSADIVALEDSLVAVMTADQFLKLLNFSPTIAINLMKKMAHVIRSTTSRLMDLSFMSANSRIYSELIRLSKHSVSLGNSAHASNYAFISPMLHHAELASRVITTRETVSRVLGYLTRRGIIQRKGNTLNILDIKRLKGLLESEGNSVDRTP